MEQNTIKIVKAILRFEARICIIIIGTKERFIDRVRETKSFVLC